MNRFTRRTAAVAVTVTALVALAGCNGDDTSSEGTASNKQSPTASGGKATAPAFKKPAATPSKKATSSPTFKSVGSVTLFHDMVLPLMAGWQHRTLTGDDAAEEVAPMYNDQSNCTKKNSFECSFFIVEPYNPKSWKDTVNGGVLNCHTNADGSYPQMPLRKTTTIAGGVHIEYYEQHASDCLEGAPSGMMQYVWRIVGNTTRGTAKHYMVVGMESPDSKLDAAKISTALAGVKFLK